MGTDEPSRQLSPLARWVWRLQQAGIFLALTIAGVIVALNLDALGPLPWIVPLLIGVAAVLGIPALRWSRCRWDVMDDGMASRHGTFTIRRTLVPWVRVQHVDTRRGLLEQGFGLATVI